MSRRQLYVLHVHARLNSSHNMIIVVHSLKLITKLTTMCTQEKHHTYNLLTLIPDRSLPGMDLSKT